MVFRYCPSGIERAKSEPSESDEAWKPTVHSQNICPTVCVNQEFVLTGTELVIVRNGGRTNQLPAMSNGADLPSESSRRTVRPGFYVLQSAFMRRDRRQGQAGSPAAEVARWCATETASAGQTGPLANFTTRFIFCGTIKCVSFLSQSLIFFLFLICWNAFYANRTMRECA